MQYIPCHSALLAQETLFLTQKGIFFAQRSPKSALIATNLNSPQNSVCSSLKFLSKSKLFGGGPRAPHNSCHPVLWRALYSTMESYPLKTLPFIVLKHLPKWWKTWPRQFFCGGQLAIFTSVSSTNPKSSLHRPGGWLSLNSSSPFQVPKMKSVVERTCSPFLIENFMIQSRPGHSSVPTCFCFLHCGTV